MQIRLSHMMNHVTKLLLGSHHSDSIPFLHSEILGRAINHHRLAVSKSQHITMAGYTGQSCHRKNQAQ